MKTLKQVSISMVAVALMSASAIAGTLSQQAGPFAAYQNSKDFENGYGAGLKYALMWNDVVPNMACGMDVRAGWLKYNGDDNDYRSDLNVVPIEVSALAGYELFKGSRPYMGVGVGYYIIDVDGDTLDIDNDIGLYGVLGWDQRLTEYISVFAEAKYLWLDPDAENSMGHKTDLEFGGFGANAGICMNW